MITEDYISFELAKLLKEKGFNESTDKQYNLDKIVGDYNITDRSRHPERYLDAPTLQMAMKWLREKCIFITLNIISFNLNDLPVWNFDIWRNNNHEYRSSDYFDSYEEACEAAIKYCLKNLIKNEDEEEESDIPVPKTVDEAISTLEKILSDEDREYLLENGAISMHHSLGRWIRNEWGLWTGSELKDELMNMNKGLNHPDDMSNYIIEEFIKYWNNKL